MQTGYYKSPIGILEIICKNNELTSLKIVDKVNISPFETDFIKSIKLQLSEYFSGKRKEFSIKINPEGTEFQKAVWSELIKIPYGKTKSYSEIAQNIGNKNAQRAVGNACNKNPIMIIIPCHRIISKKGDMAGYAYGADIKIKLLNTEKFARI